MIKVLLTLFTGGIFEANLYGFDEAVYVCSATTTEKKGKRIKLSVFNKKDSAIIFKNGRGNLLGVQL